MRILILNLPRYENASVTREGRCELILEHRVDTPATLLIIASMLREKNYQIKFIDANGFNLSYTDISSLLRREGFDCVMFTFNSWIIDHDLEVCNLIKGINPSCITIGFSWYAKKFGYEILREYQNLDILIIEDPFSVIENLMDTLNKDGKSSYVEGIACRDKENKIIINSHISSEKSFKDLPMPAYELLSSFKPYYIYSSLLKPYALVYAGKGCPFSCKYCNVANTKYSEDLLKKYYMS